jgi:AAA domain
MTKPTTHQGNLAKLPRALAPLLEREQWCVWRWTQKTDGCWQKPPFIATQPERHASTNDPNTWTNYATALAAVQAGHADGISYVLTADDPFAAIDLDHCRDGLGAIDIWAQLFLERGRNTYSEITPSGTGCRIWGLARGEKLHRKFDLVIDSKPIAAELFRRTNKALTITGLKLDSIREFTSIDKVLDWAVIWGERRKAAAAQAESISVGFGGGSNGYSVEQIEEIVRAGAPEGANRSDTFHMVVGHYLGCGWDAERILAHLEQNPHGIGERYLREGRLAGEIARSIKKYGRTALPLFDNGGWTGDWQAKTPQSTLVPLPGDPEPPEHAHEDLPADSPSQEPQHHQEPDPELQEDSDPDPDPELLDDPDLLGDDDLNETEDHKPAVELPPMYAHGDPDPRPLKSWLVKGLIPACGHGLLSGQWGTYKSFVALELATTLMTAQPFVGSMIKRQCGVLFLAAEGADEMRLRLNAAVREKCGNMPRAPFRWYETAPVLLQKGAVEKLVAMARQAEASLIAEFGLPLGLIIVDTIVVSAGYPQPGAESDPAVTQTVMNVLKEAGQQLNCFVLGVDHYGKDVAAGTRGSSAKEASADLVLACLGDREQSGTVTNTRLAVRKCRGGPQGQEFYFTTRKVEDPTPDEDGDSITTLVIDWVAAPAAAAAPQDPWAKPKRQDQRTAALRLKRVLMAILAEQGVDLPIPPDGPIVRMVDQKFVRKAFYACTPTDEGTPERKGHFRRQKFLRALDWAEDEQLIAVTGINGVTYLRLTRPGEEESEN